ncbi:MAG: hypothetical protein H0V79_04735 [Actinobacteria bacterium]|nr:hypothetical protein [Actinomycetota bacterium]
MPTVCVSASISYFNRSGGHPWLYLSWVHGLEDVGCDVIWLENVDPARFPDGLDDFLAAVEGVLRKHDVRARVALASATGAPLPWDGLDGYLTLDSATAEADLYLNLAYHFDEGVVGRFRRSAFVDQDPGVVQLCLSDGTLRVAEHDLYFTIGETVGRRGSRIPDCGLPWLRTRPPVSLRAWPRVNGGGDRYTTVSNWWGSDEWVELYGEPVSNEKRTAFLEFIDVPARTEAEIELALTLGPWDVDEAERKRLESHGWHVRPLWEETWGPAEYRAYVQGSRGEFSCAKPLYVRLETAMIHDRTLHYLASGKPAVVQHTGSSEYLPDAEGLFRFRDIDEAASALAAVEADYDAQCAHARALAQEHFAADAIASELLERALD